MVEIISLSVCMSVVLFCAYFLPLSKDGFLEFETSQNLMFWAFIDTGFYYWETILLSASKYFSKRLHIVTFNTLALEKLFSSNLFIIICELQKLYNISKVWLFRSSENIYKYLESMIILLYKSSNSSLLGICFVNWKCLFLKCPSKATLESVYAFLCCFFYNPCDCCYY